MDDLRFKVLNGFHRTVLKVTGGRMGWTAGGMPALELTTIGRKSGEARSVMLTSPVQEGDTLVIVASRGGDDRHPAWLLNLRDNPDVEVAYNGGPKRPMTATLAGPEERARLWPIITEKYKNYAGYQDKASREIPVVLLQPRSPD